MVFITDTNCGGKFINIIIITSFIIIIIIIIIIITKL